MGFHDPVWLSHIFQMCWGTNHQTWTMRFWKKKGNHLVKWSRPRICAAQESPFVGVKTVVNDGDSPGCSDWKPSLRLAARTWKGICWNTIFSFWDATFFRCELLVSGDGLCMQVFQKKLQLQGDFQTSGVLIYFCFFFWSYVITYCKSSWDENSFHDLRLQISEQIWRRHHCFTSWFGSWYQFRIHEHGVSKCVCENTAWMLILLKCFPAILLFLSLSLKKDHDACFILRMARMNLERTSVQIYFVATIFFCHLHKTRWYQLQ